MLGSVVLRSSFISGVFKIQNRFESISLIVNELPIVFQ
jgi:hypothetical protein